jgi:hypothetical protein
MNAFQKQLKFGDQCMAELAGQNRIGVGQAVPPAKVSVEEFEATQHARAVDGARCVAKTGRYMRHLYKHNICVRCGTPRN